jgi:hypothetical protein
MKRIFVLLLFMLVVGTATQAQHNKFQLGIGYQRTWMVDKQASPLKYQTSEKTFSLGYINKSAKAIFNLELNGALGDFFPTGYRNRKFYNPGYNDEGTPKKDSGHLVGTLYNARFNIGYLRKINSGFTTIGHSKLESQRYAGASLSNQLFYTDNIVRTGWLNSTSLDAVYQHFGLLDQKHSFTIKITLPLFARNTRLPYHNTISSPDESSNLKTFFKQGSRFTSILNFQNIRVNAGYEYALNKRVGLGIHYFGQWLRYQYEKPVTLFQNNISVIASFNSSK